MTTQFIQIGTAIVIKNDIKSISPREKPQPAIIFGFKTIDCIPEYDVIITMKDNTTHLAFTGTYVQCLEFITSDDCPIEVSN